MQGSFIILFYGLFFGEYLGCSIPCVQVSPVPAVHAVQQFVDVWNVNMAGDRAVYTSWWW